MKYVILGFCVVAAACGSSAPGAPTPLATSSSAEGVREAKGGTDLPFRGTLEATETIENPPIHVLNGSGTATHLGRFTIESVFTVLAPPQSTASGKATWTAANGDQIFTTTTGRAIITFPVAAIGETHTITGGTGRFAQASGTIMVERSLNLQTLVSSASLTGTISLGHGQ